MGKNQSADEAARWIAILLALVAGIVDAFGFLTYRAYLSLMSGNTTQSGFLVGAGAFSEAVPTLLAIAGFVVGVFIGTLLDDAGAPRRRRIVFGCVAALVAIDVAVTELFAIGSLLPIGLLSLAMGMMNTTVSHVGVESVNLTFVTGTLNRIGNHLAWAVRGAMPKDSQGSGDTHIRRAVLLAGMWTSFFLGAILSGISTPKFGPWVLMFPFAVLVVLSAWPWGMDRQQVEKDVAS